MIRCLALLSVPPLDGGDEHPVFAAERFVKNECDATCYFATVFDQYFSRVAT